MISTEQFNKTYPKWSSIILKKVDYTNIPVVEKEAEFQINDTVHIEVETDGVIVDFSRFVGVKPESLFSLTVSISQKYFFDLANNKSTHISLQELEEYLLNTENAAIGSLVQVTSCLISEITSTGGSTPIVTPPSLMSNTEII